MSCNYIVKIETPELQGTGVLLRCKNLYEKKYYLIVTNGHNIQKDILVGEEYKNLKLTIYNDYGEEIKRKDNFENGYRIVDLFVTENDKNDIAAILIEIDGNNPITLINKLNMEKLDDAHNLIVIGYPGILNEDNINRLIKLECRENELFPYNETIGSYKIIDEIHYYDDLNDKNILSGLSGSPVFAINNNDYCLAGINKSISIVDEGKNPFKIVYYLRIKSVLEYLYEKGVIIFNRIDKYNIDIIWIYNNIYEIKNDSNRNVEKRKLTVVLVGGSGSGKSSFAKAMSFHKKYLDVTDDGQTTRSNIYYHYNFIKENNRIEIELYSKNDFCNNILNKIESKKLFEIFKIFTDFKCDGIITNQDFLIYVYKFCLERTQQGDEISDEIKVLGDMLECYLSENNKCDKLTIFNIYCHIYYVLSKYNQNDNVNFIIRLIENINFELANKIFDSLSIIEGFFNIEEFEYLNGNNRIELEEKDLSALNDKKSDRTKNLTFYRMMYNFFEMIYDKIYFNASEFLTCVTNINEFKNKKITIHLNDDVSKEKQKLISYCLKAVKG